MRAILSRKKAVYDFIGEEVRLDGGDAVALDALHFVEGADEVEECVGPPLAEVADVHAREHDFLAALSRDVLGEGHELGNRGRAGAAARDGDGAVGAPGVASVLNLKEVAGAVTPGAGGHELAEGLGLRGHGDGSCAVPGVEIAQELELAVCACHYGHAWERGGLGGLELGVAACDEDGGSGPALVEGADGPPALAVGLLGDGTGVHDYDVRLFSAAVGGAYAAALEEPLDRGGLGEVEFAAEGVVEGLARFLFHQSVSGLKRLMISAISRASA